MPDQIKWNPSLSALPFSPIRLMFNTASTMPDVAHLSIGQPDFPTPPHIIESHIQALRDGKTRYEMDAGLPQLREAIAGFYNDRYHIDLEPDNVLVTTGCCEGMYIALTGAVWPGTEMITAEPYFVLNRVAEMAGATLRCIPTTAENGYQLDPQQVIDAITEKTSVILLNSPGNPTGAVYPRETITAICEAAAERGIALISDEVYDRLILDDADSYASALTCAPNRDNVIVSSSVSKTYSMAGMRIGWVISSKANIETMQRHHMFISTTENTASQWAVTTALTGDQSCVDEMVDAYRARRDRVVELVTAAPHLTAYRPGGAFFIMPSLPAGTDSFDFCMRMLKEAGVCTIPGGAFGESCNNGFRISFATSMDVIETAFERMTKWLEKQSF
jgi:aspartate/methionine/tyrosine aminotransferase